MAWNQIAACLVGIFGFGGILTLIITAHRYEARGRQELADAIRARGRIKTVVFYDEEEQEETDH